MLTTEMPLSPNVVGPERLERLAQDLSPYEPWEQELVKVLGSMRHSYARQVETTFPGCRRGECHHNVERYRALDPLAKRVLGWIKHDTGYLLHSMVKVRGRLVEVTPMPLKLPFVRDRELQLSWTTGRAGQDRAVITRNGRVIKYDLRTPEYAQTVIDWGRKMGWNPLMRTFSPPPEISAEINRAWLQELLSQKPWR